MDPSTSSGEGTSKEVHNADVPVTPKNTQTWNDNSKKNGQMSNAAQPKNVPKITNVQAQKTKGGGSKPGQTGKYAQIQKTRKLSTQNDAGAGNPQDLKPTG